MGEGPALPTLIPSQYNHVLPNFLTPYLVLQVTPTSVSNGPVIPDILSPSDSFPAKFFLTATIPAVTRVVCGVDLWLVAMDETMNNIYPFSYDKEDMAFLFDDTNENKEARIQFWGYQRHVS